VNLKPELHRTANVKRKNLLCQPKHHVQPDDASLLVLQILSLGCFVCQLSDKHVPTN
jgi:hypothetical protein